jgi:hypothetical protein
MRSMGSTVHDRLLIYWPFILFGLVTIDPDAHGIAVIPLPANRHAL